MAHVKMRDTNCHLLSYDARSFRNSTADDRSEAKNPIRNAPQRQTCHLHGVTIGCINNASRVTR